MLGYTTHKHQATGHGCPPMQESDAGKMVIILYELPLAASSRWTAR